MAAYLPPVEAAAVQQCVFVCVCVCVVFGARGLLIEAG
jgi:hypothetical protein